MGRLARRGYDVAHSRPHKPTLKGTPSNAKTRVTRAKQPAYGALLLANAAIRRARKAVKEAA